MSFTLDLINAACQIAVAQPGWLPQATLTVASVPGDTVLNVSDVRPFLRQTILSFWDGTAEEPVAVLSATPHGQVNAPAAVPGTLALDFSGKAKTGLVSGHALGAKVATNILDTIPVQTAEMLSNTYPVVSFFVVPRSDTRTVTRGWQAKAVLSMVYQIPATQPETNTMHAQIWTRERMVQAETDVDRFIDVLKLNQTLSVGSLAPAHDTSAFVRALRAPVTEGQTQPLWEQFVDIHVESDIINRF